MSAIFPNKTVFSIATTYSAVKTITALSNANPGVATSNAHGFSNGDILEILSGWPLLNERIVRAASVDTNTFALEGISTANTSRYPAGAGTGSAREVLTWTALSQITNSQSSGGEQQFAQWVYLEDGIQRQRPTFKNAKSLQLTLDYDPALAWYAALLAADEAGTPVALRAALPDGAFIFYNMYVGFDGEPSLNVNENMKCVATFSHAAPRFIHYPAA
jgi:hypothetical protein